MFLQKVYLQLCKSSHCDLDGTFKEELTPIKRELLLATYRRTHQQQP
jgi:hypothetical protein